MKLNDEEFDGIVRKALERIPPEITQYLENIIISVRKRPSRKMRSEMRLTPDDALFGVFKGVPLIEQSVTSPTLLPDSILLFQEPLEQACTTIEELEEQIEITVVHEIAHFIGMTEERLAELGYD